MKEKIIVANWKMNGSVDLVLQYNKLLEENKSDTRNLIVAVPYVYLQYAQKTIGSIASVAAQNIHSDAHGAYTGGVSSKMIKDIGVIWSIVGHSETRSFDCNIRNKLNNAIENDINIILCIGDNSKEISSNQEYISSILSQDLLPIYHNIKQKKLKIYIAYEPVWAIGTGNVADSNYIKNVFEIINNYCINNLGESVDLLYGGSVDINNFTELLDLTCVSGLLVGGASLKIDSLRKILTL
jgi:triosephosphate isomerase